MLAKVLLPVMVSVPAPPWSRVMLVYANEPPAKILADPEVRVTVPVPVTVRLVEVAALHAVPDPAIVQVPEPTAMVLVFELLLDRTDDAPVKDMLKLLALKVPLVIRSVLPLVEKASCSVTDPPGVTKVMGCVNVFPALVSVCAPRPANDTAPVPLIVVPVPLIQLP